MTEKHRVWIRWGSTYPTEPFCYEFDSLELLNAFLQGVGEAVGWLDHEQFDTEEEANESRQSEHEPQSDDSVL